MNIKKLLVGGVSGALILGALAIPAFAGDLFQNANNWKILDRVVLPNGGVNFMTRHPDALPVGGTTFSLLKASQGYTSYQILNYNKDLTDKTITAVVKANLGFGSFVANPAGCSSGGVAAVGIQFQDTSAGAYDSNDYWWSTDRRNLDTLGSSTTLTASLANADRSGWINQSGKPATDGTEDWVQWQGDIVHMSPYDGFTKAREDVKEVNLSFGDQCAYARGVAVSEVGDASFDLESFTITP